MCLALFLLGSGSSFPPGFLTAFSSFGKILSLSKLKGKRDMASTVKRSFAFGRPKDEELSNTSELGVSFDESSFFSFLQCTLAVACLCRFRFLGLSNILVVPMTGKQVLPAG